MPLLSNMHNISYILKVICLWTEEFSICLIFILLLTVYEGYLCTNIYVCLYFSIKQWGRDSELEVKQTSFIFYARYISKNELFLTLLSQPSSVFFVSELWRMMTPSILEGTDILYPYRVNFCGHNIINASKRRKDQIVIL